MAAYNLTTLNVSISKYEARISTLEGIMRNLGRIKDNYTAKMNEIDSIWEASEADEYKRSIQENINNVQKSIDTCNENITQLRNIVENMKNTNTGINSVVQESLELAKNLFT